VIRPVVQNEAFLADVMDGARARGALRLWWLGQSGFLFQWEGRHLLMDPYLSDSLTKKYAGTDKPHVRMTERVVAPQKLDFIDVVSSSHNHTDHLDGETLRPLIHANPDIRLIIPEANREFAASRLQVDPRMPLGLDDGTSASAAGFRLTGVASAHEELERDPEGRCKFLGYIVEVGPWKIYHSGDTVWYEGMTERLRPWAPDVAFLPINGRSLERRVPGNLSGREAAKLAKEIRAGLVVPCHYEMFEFNTASPDEFVAEAERLSQSYRVLKCGERFTAVGSGQ
jgi:L-ascorbate metabolism protein UlaG (beta-lactamase superfamily)